MLIPLNYLALLVLSLMGTKSHDVGKSVLTSFTNNQKVQAAVLDGNLAGLKEMVSKAFFGQKLELLDPESAVVGMVERLVPGLSALVMIEHLLSFASVTEQKKQAGKMVDRGLFRKFGVGGAVAPELIHFSLERRPSTSQLWEERARLIEANKRLLNNTASEY